MVGFLKRRKKKEQDSTEAEQAVAETVVEQEQIPEQAPAPMPAVEAKPEPKTKKGFFSKLRSGLKKTRSQLGEGVANLVLGQKAIDDDLIEELETQLLIADIGIEATKQIIADLTSRVSRKELDSADALLASLKKELADILRPCTGEFVLPQQENPFVILMIGINGAGKTTTIGKLAKQFQQQGKQVMLAAGDTFRAAAVEQLQVWGERNQINVVAQHTGADSASVVFDALESAKAKSADVLLADSAGRLHTQSNLMDELKKVKRVMGKIDEQAPHETWLVLDASIGQNALRQAQEFHQAIGVTGIIITKLDGTAKGGIVFAIAKELGLPIRFIGIGEGIDDLRPFAAEDFVEALFDHDSSEPSQ